jgi:endogenous inhibitor of DNA gyrase (YacG/DUF329 family)
MSEEASELGRKLQAMRKPRLVTCPICGTQVEKIGRAAAYCSKRCANLAWWRKHRGKAPHSEAEVQPTQGASPSLDRES